MDKEFKFNLGSEVSDIITGFKGIIRVRSEYLTGCNTYGIQSQKLNKEGDITDWIWFDENQLKLVKDKKIKLDTNMRDKGGPLSDDQFSPSR